MKLNTKNLGTGFLYFYVHFITELICFFVLGRYFESTPVMWLIPLTYDMLAFVPQAVFGYVNHKFQKIPFGAIGLGLLGAALILQACVPLPFLSLSVLCIGNVFTHVNGAQVTIRTSDGSLSHSAIFVSGGSFGVIFGKLLSASSVPYWLLLFLVASAVPFTILAQMYLKGIDGESRPLSEAFSYNNKNISRELVIILAFIVVTVRGYMAYSIPISWNKTTLQNILLFSFMGTGKALGGILADRFGIKKTALFSVIAALPFLMFGDNNMYLSLTGVLLFSMTMSITLALLVSALPDSPGLAFGLTTIGLFVGAIPIFIFRVTSLTLNCIMLSVLTAVCVLCLILSVRKDKVNG